MTSMPMRVVLFILACCSLCAYYARGADGPQPVDDEVYRILIERNVPIDVDKTRRASLEGLVKAVDPAAKILSVEQVRDLAARKSVKVKEQWAEGIYYLQLAGVYKDAADSLVSLIKEWAGASATGVILDLRLADGDNLGSVDRIAELFVSSDPLLYQVKDGRDGVVETHRVRQGAALPGGGVPLVVLVNNGTCEGGELLAAVLKGRKNVLVVGGMTKGDAAVRENIPVSNNETIRIATRRIAFNGVQYDSIGVKPDVLVPQADDKSSSKLPDRSISIRPISDKAKLDRELMERVYSDPVLLRATDILLGLKAAGSYGIQQTAATNTSNQARSR
jgi:C-terminal processing protease CtpA/Prc